MSTTDPRKLKPGDVVDIVAGVGLYGIPSRGKMRVVILIPGGLELVAHPADSKDVPQRFTFSGKDKLTNGRGWFRVRVVVGAT